MTKERIQKTTQQQEFCIRSGGGLEELNDDSGLVYEATVLQLY
jgi:hypothetical protein